MNASEIRSYRFASSKSPLRNAFENDEDWEALADTFNSMLWMRHLGVRLRQREMDDVSTIGELTTLIAGKPRRGSKLAGAEFDAPERA